MGVLTYFVATGYLLRSAYLMDQVGRRTNLSLEAFDGLPIGDRMRELQIEYQLVISL